MASYHFLPHTADEQFVVTAESLDAAFATAVRAFNEIIVSKQDVLCVTTKQVEVHAPRLRTLLYDFLSELIFLYDDEGLILNTVQQLTIAKDNDQYLLTATLCGDSKENYDIRTEIKSMTYSDMQVKEKDGVVTLSVVVDI